MCKTRSIMRSNPRAGYSKILQSAAPAVAVFVSLCSVEQISLDYSLYVHIETY